MPVLAYKDTEGLKKSVFSKNPCWDIIVGIQVIMFIILSTTSCLGILKTNRFKFIALTFPLTSVYSKQRNIA